MDELAHLLYPTLIWGAFVRALGFVFFVSFVSLAVQVIECAGSQAVFRVTPRLEKIAHDFPSFRRFFYFPTLLWLSSSDFMLRALTLVGAAASLVVIFGGPLGFWALLTCYVCYLSLDLAIALVFPWDCVLFECVVLALFLPPTHALPNIAMVSAPAPALAWAFRYLLFRVMFGFGKQKFFGSRAEDLAYLKGFLIAQTLPSPLAWYAQKVPAWMLKGAILFMFLEEIVFPFFAFVPGWPSVVFAVCTVFLMIGIQAMGTFGYFSLVTIVGCLPLLDQATPAALDVSKLFSTGQPVLVNVFVVVHTLAATVALAFNSWIAHSWHLWAFWYQLPRFVQPVFAFFRLIYPFRLVHAYGVFPPYTMPGVKIMPLVEVSWDDKEWHELEFHYSPTHEKSPPKFIAPHHPRTDQALIYEVFGFTPNSLMNSVLGPFDPNLFSSRSFATRFCQRVLRGEASPWVKGAVLDAHREPPISARITAVMLEPVSIAEHRQTGAWWKRTYVGPHTPPQKLDPDFDSDALTEPELWHFDAICWRRRSRLKPLMQRALAGAEDPMTLVLFDAPELGPADVERFWNEFVPLLSGQGGVRNSFDTLPDVVAVLNERYDRKQRRALYRLLGRFSLLAIARLEPLYLHRGTKPLVPTKTYFELWMLVQHVIGCGRQAYLEAYERPLSIGKHLPDLTPQTGLYALSIFRLEDMTFEAQKLRLLEEYMYPHDPEKKRLMDALIRDPNIPNAPPAERFVFSVARRVSGFFAVVPYIRDSFKGPKFDHGYAEKYPRFTELPTGEVVVLRSSPSASVSTTAQQTSV